MIAESLEGIDAVIFDLDETLIDAPRGLEAAHRSVIAKIVQYFDFDEEYSEEGLAEELSKFDDEMNSERRYDRDRWWPEFVERIGLEQEIDESRVKELTRIYWRTYADNAKPYPDSRPVLTYLERRGYSLGMITDTDGPGVSKRDRISSLQISKLFDAIVIGGDDTEESKPSPAPFRLVASKLGVGVEDCVMVGDKPFTDIKGAKSVGMKTILINRRDWDGGAPPDLRIDSLSEIQNLL